MRINVERIYNYADQLRASNTDNQIVAIAPRNCRDSYVSSAEAASNVEIETYVLEKERDGRIYLNVLSFKEDLQKATHDAKFFRKSLTDCEKTNEALTRANGDLQLKLDSVEEKINWLTQQNNYYSECAIKDANLKRILEQRCRHAGADALENVAFTHNSNGTPLITELSARMELMEYVKVIRSKLK